LKEGEKEDKCVKVREKEKRDLQMYDLEMPSLYIILALSIYGSMKRRDRQREQVA